MADARWLTIADARVTTVVRKEVESALKEFAKGDLAGMIQDQINSALSQRFDRRMQDEAPELVDTSIQERLSRLEEKVDLFATEEQNGAADRESVPHDARMLQMEDTIQEVLSKIEGKIAVLGHDFTNIVHNEMHASMDDLVSQVHSRIREAIANEVDTSNEAAKSASEAMSACSSIIEHSKDLRAEMAAALQSMSTRLLQVEKQHGLLRKPSMDSVCNSLAGSAKVPLTPARRASLHPSPRIDPSPRLEPPPLLGQTNRLVDPSPRQPQMMLESRILRRTNSDNLLSGGAQAQAQPTSVLSSSAEENRGLLSSMSERTLDGNVIAAIPVRPASSLSAANEENQNMQGSTSLDGSVASNFKTRPASTLSAAMEQNRALRSSIAERVHDGSGSSNFQTRPIASLAAALAESRKLQGSMSERSLDGSGSSKFQARPASHLPAATGENRSLQGSMSERGQNFDGSARFKVASSPRIPARSPSPVAAPVVAPGLLNPLSRENSIKALNEHRPPLPMPSPTRTTEASQSRMLGGQPTVPLMSDIPDCVKRRMYPVQ